MSEITPIKTLVTIEPLNVASTAQNNTQTNTVLGNVANGTLLEGFVVNRNSTNQPVLRTQLGDVLLNTDLFLKTGTEVTIRVDNSQPNLARIISINGQTPEQFGEVQKLQTSKLQSDSLSNPLIASAEIENTAAPKPVQLPGVMLQLSARQTLPPPIADALFKALGIDPAAKPQQAAAPNIPLSIALRSITTPQANTPAPIPTPAAPTQLQTPPLATPIPLTQATPQTVAPQANTPLQPVPAPSLTSPETVSVTPNNVTQNVIPAPTTASHVSQDIPQTAATPTPTTPNVPNAVIASVTPALPATTQAPSSPTAAIPAPALRVPATTLAPTQPAITPEAVQFNAPQPVNVTAALRPIPTAPVLPTASEPSIAIPAAALPLPTEPRPATHSQPAPLPHNFSEVQVTPERSVVLQGLVIGQEQQRDTILHTPIGSMRLFTPKPLPSGAIVTMELTAPAPEKTPGDTLGNFTKLPPIDPVESLLREWPELSGLNEELERNDPALLQNTLARVLPTPGKQLTHMMLFFLSAVKNGDLKQWIGSRNTDILESRYAETIRKLGGDFATLQQVFTDPSPQGWISTGIPIYYDHQLEHARLHIRQDTENPTNKKQPGGQRFIIDIELSRLGEMQIDGLVQKEAGKHQFDMIIRTSKSLPPEVENDIRTIYNNASETTGFKGMLIFQPSREHFVTIQAKPRTDGQSGIIA